MATPFEKLQAIHAQSYNDMPFEEFKGLYQQKFYSDLTEEQFNKSLGISAEPTPTTEVTENDSTIGIGRQVAQGVTFGFGDEIEAGLQYFFGDKSYSENLDQIRSEMSAFQEENPATALTAEIAGGFASPAMILRVPQYISKASSLISGGLKGAAGGFAYGLGTAEGGVSERVEEGLVSAGTGALIGAPFEKLARSVGPKLENLVRKQNTVPTLKGLETIKNAAYEAVDESAFALGPNDIKTAIERASKVAADEQYVTTKGATTAVDKAKNLLTSLQSQGLTLGQSERVRRRLFKLADADAENGYIVRQMIDEFDNVVDEAMESGGTDALKAARAANASYKKAQTVQETFDKISPEVGNTSKAFKSAALKLVNDKRKMKYFNKFEKEMLTRMASGDLPTNLAGYVGKLSPTSNGLMALLNVGVAVTNPWMLLLTTTTIGSKTYADKATVRKAKELVEKIGGMKKVREASRLEDAATAVVSGVSANDIREAFLLNEQPEEQQEEQVLNSLPQ